MRSPIDIDAEPIARRSPYRRIDPMHPDRKTVMTREELNAKFRAGASLRDLEAWYRHDDETDLYYLREEFL